MTRRFSVATLEILHGVDAFIPSHESFLKFEILKSLAIQYKANINDFQVELRQMARMIERKRADNTLPAILMDSELPVLEFHNFVTRYKDAFFELYTLFKIACTIHPKQKERLVASSLLKLT